MGWTFTGKTKEALVNEILNQRDAEVIISRMVGSHLWVGFRKDNLSWIELFLLKGGRDGYGYKDIPEQFGPAYYDCPLAVLRAVPAPNDDHSKAWRSAVEAHHQRRHEDRKKKQVGATIRTWRGEVLKVVQILKGKKYSIVCAGSPYRYSPAQVTLVKEA